MTERKITSDDLAKMLSKKTSQEEIEKILQTLGMEADSISVLSNPDLQLSRMAILGCLTALKGVIETCAAEIRANPAANPKEAVKMFNTSLQGFMFLLEKASADYESTLENFRKEKLAKKAVDKIVERNRSSSQEELTTSSTHPLTELTNSTDELNEELETEYEEDTDNILGLENDSNTEEDTDDTR